MDFPVVVAEKSHNILVALTGGFKIDFTVKRQSDFPQSICRALIQLSI
jgi:hypothetical protein